MNDTLAMTKQEQFLWMVQAAILANGINLASNPDRAKHYRHCYSTTGALIVVGEAVRASQRIPAKMKPL